MKSKHQSFLWLAAGTILMLFSNGRWIIPIATWIYPVFFLRFIRLQHPFRGFISLMLVSALVSMIIWWQMIPAPQNVYFLLTGIALQIPLLSFLADRLLATQVKGFLSTLIFPTSFCTIEYLMSLIPAKGSWMSLAYTQVNNAELMQLVSVTGIWGISFLITWFASVVNWAWSQNFKWVDIRKGTIKFASITACIFLFGNLRINFFQPSASSVLTASIVQARDMNKELNSCTWTDAKSIRNYSSEVENNLLDKTQQAARAGAKIILWQEAASWLPKQEEEKFVARAAALASQEKIYLFMTLWSVSEDYPRHLVENKLIMIDTTGTKQLVYFKSNPVSIEPIVKGNGTLPVVQTAFGKIGTAICSDGDFQNFIRKAGKQRADIMLLPANDWKAIDPIHTNMAITRAIENGFSLVHPAGQGLSVATDNRGRIISSMDFYTTEAQVMYANVPIQHSFTIYTQVGDVFAWLCIACFVIMTISVIFKKYSVHSNAFHKNKDVIPVAN